MRFLAYMHVTISCYKTHPRLLRQYHSLCIALYCRVAGELPVLRSTISAQHFEPKAALGIAVSHNLPTLLQQFTDVTRFKVLEKVKHTRGWGVEAPPRAGEARIPPSKTCTQPLKLLSWVLQAILSGSMQPGEIWGSFLSRS